ncbi:MAG: acetylglutamate kinase ArgB [Pseudomonadota bacterium]
MSEHLLSTITSSYPRIEALRGKTVLVKYGGAAMEDERTRHLVCQEVAALHELGVKLIVVHGGGKEISRMMERVGLIPRFIDGLRVTDPDAMRITEMVLSGTINGDLVSRISRSGAPALGLSGRDAHLIEAKKLLGTNGEDLGQTGEVTATNASPILTVLEGGFVPVISPVGETVDGEPLNLNADYAAAAIAGALKVENCVFLTDVAGVKKDGEVQPSLSRKEIDQLLSNGTISGGMIPKVQCALRAVEAGCARSIICDASRPLSISSALTGSKGSGTVLSR